MRARSIAAVAALPLLGACADTALSIICPPEPDPAIAVAVVDTGATRSLTRQASGWFTVGAQSDSLRYRATPSGEGLFATGPVGSYRIEVRVPGYAPWSADGVRVAASACGVQTVRLVATPRPQE